uniref:Uncharacterized protein n=1 Tax=Suricata suricatta TaxID=37032 RepID=A0A673TQG5_SURSU
MDGRLLEHSHAQFGGSLGGVVGFPYPLGHHHVYELAGHQLQSAAAASVPFSIDGLLSGSCAAAASVVNPTPLLPAACGVGGDSQPFKLSGRCGGRRGHAGEQAAAHPHQLHRLAAGGAGEGVQREPLPRRVHAGGAGAAPGSGRVPSAGKDRRFSRSQRPTTRPAGAGPAFVPGGGPRPRFRARLALAGPEVAAGIWGSGLAERRRGRLGRDRRPRSNRNSGCVGPGSCVSGVGRRRGWTVRGLDGGRGWGGG